MSAALKVVTVRFALFYRYCPTCGRARARGRAGSKVWRFTPGNRSLPTRSTNLRKNAEPERSQARAHAKKHEFSKANNWKSAWRMDGHQSGEHGKRS